jgi:putative endonuclease
MWRGVFYNIKRGKGQKRCGERRITAGLFSAVGDRSLALRLEYRIKQLTKRQKERLVAGDGSFEALREA